MFHQKTRYYVLFSLCSVVIITWLYFSYFFCELSMFFVSFQNRSQFFKSVFWEFHALYLDPIYLLPQLLSEPPPPYFWFACLYLISQNAICVSILGSEITSLEKTDCRFSAAITGQQRLNNGWAFVPTFFVHAGILSGLDLLLIPRTVQSVTVVVISYLQSLCCILKTIFL